VSSTDPIRDAKRRISAALLNTAGVSGVGLQAGEVTVCLETDDEKLRQHASAAARSVAPEIGLRFEVSGSFEKQ
jgi:hypothetical protein